MPDTRGEAALPLLGELVLTLGRLQESRLLVSSCCSGWEYAGDGLLGEQGEHLGQRRKH